MNTTSAEVARAAILTVSRRGRIRAENIPKFFLAAKRLEPNDAILTASEEATQALFWELATINLVTRSI